MSADGFLMLAISVIALSAGLVMLIRSMLRRQFIGAAGIGGVFLLCGGAALFFHAQGWLTTLQ